MSHTSLAELYRQSVKYPGPSLRMVGLCAVLNAVEEQLDHLKEQRAVQLYAHLRKEAHTMATDDVEYEVYQLKRVVEELFPKVFRGGFIIQLWSVFESCIKDIAEYVRQEKNVLFGLQELRGGDFLAQTDKFFTRVLSINVFPEKSIRAKLEELKGFRNALAHHDGATEELPKTLHCKTEAEYQSKGLLVYSDLHHQYAVPTAEYTEEAFSAVRAFLEQFAEIVYIALHPDELEDEDEV